MPSNTPEFNTEEPVRVNHRARNIVIAVVVVAALAVAGAATVPAAFRAYVCS